MNMGLMRLTHVRPEVTLDATVLETVKTMAEAEIGAIAIKSGRKIVGIFTERDLMRRVVARERDPARTPIKDVMTTSIETVLDSTSVARAISLMRARRIRHLVIVDANGDYLGMLAQRHLLYDLTSELELKVGDLAGYLMTDGPGG
jgi:CBS domain-containing protein